jgi:isopenicillin-N N-acyltransferase-like protein
MKKFFVAGGLILLLLVTFVLRTYHSGVFPMPSIPSQLDAESMAKTLWIPKEKYGINQLVLHGPAYERGLEAGRLTEHLLLQQEDELVRQLRFWLPSDALIKVLILGGILWFQGADRYFEDWMVQEMAGVSLHAPKKYDFLADGFTRQIAYHGLHEVGQMVVDQGFEAMGCTVVALPFKGSWVLGRNFDFEGGRIFDSEKIMKWVFPERGHSFVSVIWAGMVGAVTGVNDQGLYISLNAAGSSDFRRVGTPSTLVLLKALQFASTAEEALDIFQKEQMFITDIFVLLDSKHNKLYRIEKSPDKIAINPLSGPQAIANHLVDPIWDGDEMNNFRREQLTSSYREVRGQLLVQELAQKKFSRSSDLQLEILKILRDKGEADGKALHLGNRRAIDPLIAAHSVIFDGEEQHLYVSQGPGVSGAFTGFDLKASFEKQMPVVIENLPPDPIVSSATFHRIRASNWELSLAQTALRRKDCNAAQLHLQEAIGLFQEQGPYYEVLGNWYQACQQDEAKAKQAWSQSLALHPAYHRTEESLRKKLGL